MVSTLTCSAAFSACTSPSQTEGKRRGERGGGDGRRRGEEGRNVGEKRREGSERVYKLENHITTVQ